MDPGHPAHPDFIASTAAQNRLDTDPENPAPLVSGLSAKRELIQQYQAIQAYTRSMYAEATPPESAIEALRHTAHTYGMDYPELFAQARSDFFRNNTTSDPENHRPSDS